jgi:hypothetical protein
VQPPNRTDKFAGVDRSITRTLSGLIAWGRVGIGVTALAAPTLMSRPWIGAPAADPSARVLARAMGGRDLALGIGTLRALSVSDREARPWVALGGTADLIDALATVAAFGHLPRRSRWGILGVTIGAAVASTRAAVSLDEPSPASGQQPR